MYYPVLPSIIPQALCTTKYYSVPQSSTPHYKVLLQHHSVLCTTKYYYVLKRLTWNGGAQASLSNLTKYCACHTKWLACLILVTCGHVIYDGRCNRCHLPTSPTPAPAQVSPSELTNYCASQAKRLTCLISVTHEKWFAKSEATRITLQPHQILHLSRKTTHMLFPRHIWNFIYTARSNKCHTPTSPSLACHPKWLARLILVTDGNAIITLRGATSVTLQPHQILHLPRKMTLQNLRKKMSENRRKIIYIAGTIREWSNYYPSGPSVKPSVRKPPRNQGYIFRARHEHFLLKTTKFRGPAFVQKFTQRSTCHKSRISNSPSAAPATKSHTWSHQVLHLPRKVTLEIHQTSPNTSRATQKDSHAWSSSPMKCYLHCAEQQMSFSNLTIYYCACHAKGLTCSILVTDGNAILTLRGAAGPTSPQILRLPPKMTLQNFKENVTQGFSDHDPRPIRPWSGHETVSPQPASQPRFISGSPPRFNFLARFPLNIPVVPHEAVPEVSKGKVNTSRAGLAGAEVSEEKWNI